MRQQKQAVFEIQRFETAPFEAHKDLQQKDQRQKDRRQYAPLDLVVPFTTPGLTRATLDAANRLGGGLNAVIRLIRVQVVPFPLDLKHSPVLMGFLNEQLRHLPSAHPTHCEICLARDFKAGLETALNKNSLVIFASRTRPWRTRTERLANCLRKAGHTVVMVSGEESSHHA